MGAPVSGIKAAEDLSAEALLDALKNVAAAERRKHATVLNYWLSIRGDRHFPPIRDLDPLEISDAGPSSVLLELIGGGEDAEIRHLGQAIKAGVKVERSARPRGRRFCHASRSSSQSCRALARRSRSKTSSSRARVRAAAGSRCSRSVRRGRMSTMSTVRHTESAPTEAKRRRNPKPSLRRGGRNQARWKARKGSNRA